MHAGISGLISDHPEVPSVVDYTDEDKETKTACSKDTGTRKSYRNGPEDTSLLCVVVAILKHGSPYTSQCQVT